MEKQWQRKEELSKSRSSCSMSLHYCSCSAHCPAHLVCPMRWALAAACRSFCGLKSLATNSTVSAPTRLSPTPPAKGGGRAGCRREARTSPAARNCLPSVSPTCPRAEEEDKRALILFKVLYCNEPLLSPHRTVQPLICEPYKGIDIINMGNVRENPCALHHSSPLYPR